jgi:hypothetical protein
VIELAGCTVVAANYLPFASVLARSWARHHPADPFTVLVLDDPAASLGEGVRVMVPEDVGLDPDELRVQMAMYGPVELATALKPHLLRRLLDDGAAVAVFLDPDTEVHAPLHGLAELASARAVALTPHTVAPVPRDGRSPSALEIGATGVFNGGLIAVAGRGRAFLEWWAAQLRRDCVMDPGRGLFVDQRFLDWVPSLFEHAVSRDTALNVAYWNLHERRLGIAGDAFTIDGRPLAHFHFSGFDPSRPRRLTTYDVAYPRPLRVQIAPGEPLERLCAGYAARLGDAGFRDIRSVPYGHGRTAAGMPITAWARLVYRAAVLAAEERGDEMPPSPFDPAAAAAFERLVESSAQWAELPLRVQARLEQLRGNIDDSPRRGSSGFRHRLATGVRRFGRRAAGRPAPVPPAPDDALRALLIDIERRLDRQLPVPDDLEGYLRATRSSPLP